MTIDQQQTSMTVPKEEITYSYSRSSGAGGQHVNKVNTRVTLRWHVVNSKSISEGLKARFIAKFSHRLTSGGEIIISSEKFRDQRRNQEDCNLRLLNLIEQASTPEKPRRKTKPTRSSQQKRLDSKKAHSHKKQLRQKIN